MKRLNNTVLFGAGRLANRMTKPLECETLALRIQQAVPVSEVHWDNENVWIRPDTWLEVASLLKDNPDLDFSFLSSVTAVDYIEYFELVYHLTSLRHNHSAVIKMRCYERDVPVVPSVTSVWRGADLQEREAWDLMGINFEGHPNMKRILLWEGFPGHPLRKDFLG